MEKINLPPIERLLLEYEKRRAKNSHFSLRAFAKVLGISPSRISEFLSGKRNFSKTNAYRISSRLGFSPDETQAWLASLGHTSRKIQPNPTLRTKEGHYLPVPEDIFRLIADWEHFAILTFLETDISDKSEQSISDHLNLKELVTKSALKRLKRLNFIKYEGDQVKKSVSELSTTTDVPSAALRSSHKQSISQAIECLENVDVMHRDITSITIPTNPKKLLIAKKLIKNFRRQLAAILEEGEKTEVYNLNIQLVPLTNISDKKSST